MIVQIPHPESKKLNKLKLSMLNAENLFLLSDQELNLSQLNLSEQQWQKLSTSIYENKPLTKLKQLAQIFLHESPDIIMLCEVGGLESLQNFNKLFLQDQYSAALIEGNSDRNIDVGYLIKKGLPFYFDIYSNKNRPLNFLYSHEREALEQGFVVNNLKLGASHKFSRDAAELHLFISERENPFCIFVLTHLKSRLDPDSIDPNGLERRQAELETLIEIYKELTSKFGPKMPILVAGDFNGNASDLQTDIEFKKIYQETDLRDVLSLDGVPPEDRWTFCQVGRNSKGELRQLDYVFLSSQAQKHFVKGSAKVFRYLDPRGKAMDAPSNMDQKLLLPSDHYPIFFEMQILDLLPDLT